MEQELVQVKGSPAEMIMAAVTANTDLDKLKGLMELQERWEANEARKAFAKAFSIAQANMVPVMKSKFNPQTKSKYSDLADVIETAQPIYTAEGFAVTFDEGESPIPEHMRVTAEVEHCLGHKKGYHLDVPLDGKGIQGNANMTKIHGKASSMSYGRRYLMCMIWNIPTSDVDGNTQALPTITETQVKQILDLMVGKDITEKGLLDYLKTDKLENIKADDFMKALNAINIAKKKGA